MARRNGDAAAAAARGSSHLLCFDSEICGGSSDLLSFPSQPPDVRNWFSSYDYESPKLSALPDDLGSFLLSEEDESETQDPLLHSADRVNEDPPIPESLGITPNVKSSISKGSPQYQSSPRANSIVVKEFEGKSSEKHGDGDTNHLPSATTRSSVERYEQSPDRLHPIIDCNEQCSHQIDPKRSLDLKVEHKFPYEEESHPNHNVGEDDFVSAARKDDMLISRVNYEDLDANEENQSCKIGVPQDGEDFLSSRADELSDSPQCKYNSFSGTDIHRSKTRNVIPEKSKHGIKRKLEDESSRDSDEEPREIAAKTGFISRKKREDSSATRAIQPPGSSSTVNLNVRDLTSQETNRSMGYKEKPEAGSRSVLADKTNLQTGAAAAAAMENPGKWRCPRKSKPYMGPPLKQLRLEHWVRRVN